MRTIMNDLRSHGERMGSRNDAAELEIAPELTPEMEAIIGKRPVIPAF